MTHWGEGEDEWEAIDETKLVMSWSLSKGGIVSQELIILISPLHVCFNFSIIKKLTQKF